jgi:tubulin---tyrosine ligase
VFALSSGTLGAALEAAVCGYRAIAISFAFFDRKNLPDVVDEACKHGARVCEWLAKNGHWDDGKLYSVNVPLKKGVKDQKVVWTKLLQNTWKKGACFQELPPASSVDDPVSEEAKLRRQESGDGNGTGTSTPSTNQWRHRHFKWAPRFTDVYDAVERAGPGSDGWAVKEGQTSVSALTANFMHAEPCEGEVKL